MLGLLRASRASQTALKGPDTSPGLLEGLGWGTLRDLKYPPYNRLRAQNRLKIDSRETPETPIKPLSELLSSIWEPATRLVATVAPLQAARGPPRGLAPLPAPARPPSSAQNAAFARPPRDVRAEPLFATHRRASQRTAAIPQPLPRHAQPHPSLVEPCRPSSASKSTRQPATAGHRSVHPSAAA